MKKFIRHFIVFVFLIVFFNICVYNVFYNNYIAHYINLDIKSSNILFADSHGIALDKKNTEYSFYNGSASSDSYVDIKRKLQFLIKNNKKIKRVLVSIDNHMVSNYRDEFNNNDRSLYFQTLNDYENFYFYIRDNLMIRSFPILNPKSRGVYRKYLFARNKEKKEPNWFGSEKDKILKTKNRLKVQFPLNELSEEQTREFIEIVEICEKNKIELIGVKFPVTKEYATEVKNKQIGVNSFFKKRSIRILNFSNLYTNDSLFSDQDHLNKKGGKLFSYELFKLLK